MGENCGEWGLWILKGGDFVFLFGCFSVGGGGFFRFVGLGDFLGGIVDILNERWDLWGEWERRVGEWESGEVG